MLNTSIGGGTCVKCPLNSYYISMVSIESIDFDSIEKECLCYSVFIQTKTGYFTIKCKRLSSKPKKNESQMSFRYNNVSDVRLVTQTQQSIYILILIIDSMKNRFYLVFLPKKNANSSFVNSNCHGCWATQAKPFICVRKICIDECSFFSFSFLSPDRKKFST